MGKTTYVLQPKPTEHWVEPLAPMVFRFQEVL